MTIELGIVAACLSIISRIVQVAVADLDCKPLEKIEEHFELDCAILHQAKQRRLAAMLS